MSRSNPYRVLVIANRTCPCPGLADDVAEQATGARLEVLVVAPALNSRLRHFVSDSDGAVAEAKERLETAVAALRARSVSAEARVGDSDPARAIADALVGFSADAIVISTHPPGRSNWLEKGLVEKVRNEHRIPVTHLVSRYGLEVAV